ncbi:MAG: glycosyltransferase family 2 protein [Candidatus Aminicenantes bacterium]|nr:glycosyltransferase family 2 protein [Candidatus Aminicenantes bacterium]
MIAAAPAKTGLSVIVPVLNEAESLPELERQIRETCVRLSRTYEIIFIDDGSTDGTFEVLKGLCAANPLIRVVRFRKNFGQTAALAAGFDRARGEIILTLDADLQNDPSDFPSLLAKLDEGYDIVSGWRQKRKDRFITRRLPSILANWLISRITGVKLHDYGCTLKAFRRDVIKNIRLYGELHRFIPALASKMGVAVSEVKVNHRPRRHGKSKYTISRTVRVVLDLLTVKFLLSYSTRPLQIFGLFGIVSLLAGTVISAWLAYERLILRVAIGGRPLLLLAVLLIVIGIQFITLGLLAEIMVRAYHEAAHQPTYFVREVLGDEPQDPPGDARA